MKAIRSVVAAGAALALLVGCSAEGGDAPETVTVALLDSGSRTDGAWSQAWYEGAEAAQEALGDSAIVTTTDQLAGSDALEKAGGAALSEGARAFIIATSEAPQALDRLGQKFPDRFVCGVEPPRESYRDNVCTIYPHMEQGAFLAGVAAALATKTKHVGTIGAFDSPTLTAQMEGFALGVRYVDPTITVERAYTMSLSDSGAARAAAEAQYDAGADIIFVVVSEGRTGVFAAAEKHNGYVIGANGAWSDEAPELIVTSVLYNFDLISKTMLELAAKGKLEARSYDFTLADGPYGELAEPVGAAGELLSADAWSQLQDLQSAIAAGDVEIPNAHVIGQRDAADSYDMSLLGR